MSDTIKEPQAATEIVQSTGTLGFGIGQLNKPTPMWVTWIFRTQFVLNKAIMMWIASTSFIAQEKLKETILALSIIDFVVWGLGRFVGITKEEIEK